jgi:hypothetical protein
MPRPLEIHLDVETDWHHNLTVVGFRSPDDRLVSVDCSWKTC